MNIRNINQKHGTKILASVITISILSLLLISGPAQAFDINFGINGAENNKYTANQGEIVKFLVSIDINDKDFNLNINKLKLLIDGPETKTAEFDVNANILSGFEGLAIKRIPTNVNSGYGYGYGYNNGYAYDFGYGYGYGYGYGTDNKLTYEVTIDTDYFKLGTYNTELKVLIGSKWFTQTGDKLVIKESIDTSGSSNPNDDEDNEDDEDNDNQSGTNNNPTFLDNIKDGVDKIIDNVKDFTNSITGAVVGALGKPGTIVVGVFLIGLIGLLVVILLRRY